MYRPAPLLQPRRPWTRLDTFITWACILGALALTTYFGD